MNDRAVNSIGTFRVSRYANMHYTLRDRRLYSMLSLEGEGADGGSLSS